MTTHKFAFFKCLPRFLKSSNPLQTGEIEIEFARNSQILCLITEKSSLLSWEGIKKGKFMSCHSMLFNFLVKDR